MMRRCNCESDARRVGKDNGQHDRNGFPTTPSHSWSRKAKGMAALSAAFQCDGSRTHHLAGVNPRMTSTFSMIAVLFLVGVHLYLYHCSAAMVVSREPQIISKLFALKAKNGPKLTSLRDIDREFYTVRINTWKRPEQLSVSVKHHASCPGAKQIQIVWCDTDEEPPASVLKHPKVVIERHSVNSLNERFHILQPEDTPTLGILSIDDDVLRPCEAIDNGFLIWTQNPERMVGFDARVHVVNQTDGSWKYGYQSTTEEANEYSLSLPRYSFIHRDYLEWYTTDLPRSIFSKVATSFNCEDMAMSLFISSLTDGRPPLLADLWAIKSMIKLYSEKRISAQQNHKPLRDECVNVFAEQLQVKVGKRQLQTATFVHQNEPLYDCGDQRKELDNPSIERLAALVQKVHRWKLQGITATKKELNTMKAAMSLLAYQLGLIESSDKWKERWKSSDGKEQ